MKGSSSGFGELKKLHQQAARAREQARREQAASRVHKQAAPVPAEDAQLFRRAMQAVTPLSALPNAQRASVGRADGAPSPEQLAKRQAAIGLACEAPASALSDHFAPPLHNGEGLAWFAPDMASDTLRRLQRGQWPVQARLDLHGLRVDAAREALNAFLADCLAHRLRCVRVIHGKGYGSAGEEPVLRQKTPAWLMQHTGVCAFVQAPRSEGGEGALLVLLKGSKPAQC